MTDRGRVRSLAKQILDEPDDVPDDDPLSEVSKIRHACLRGIARIRPSLLESPRGLALYVKCPRFDGATNRWSIVIEHVCDLVEPDPQRSGASTPTEPDEAGRGRRHGRR